MSTQTIEHGADLEALEALLSTRQVERGWNGERRERFTHTLSKGATAYEVRFNWPERPEDRMESPYEAGMAEPNVAIIKSNKTSQHVISWFDAPKYVSDYIGTMRRELARHEQARHGIAPISWEAQGRWDKHGLKTGVEIRRAEHYLKTIERPGVRRTQAQEIAAEMVHSFIERAEHDDAIEAVEHDRDVHWEVQENQSIEIEEMQKRLKAAQDAIDHCGAFFFDRLDESDPFAYAYGDTTVDKIKDLARDAIDAIERYDATTI